MTKANETEVKPIIVSIIPNFVGIDGHVYPYHQSVGLAAKKLGWEHIAAVTPNTKIKNIPANFNPCLDINDLEKEGNFVEKIFRIYEVIKLGFLLAQYLRQEVFGKSYYSIIFMERFIHLQLLSLTISLLLVDKSNLSVWLLYRRDTHQAKTRFIYKFLNNIIGEQLKPGKFKLLTDSESLSQSLSNYFHQPVTVMPIPHTDLKLGDSFPKKSNDILCWWPGDPRPEKGLKIMKCLVNYEYKFANKLCIIAATSSQLISVNGGFKVKLIEDSLTRNDYCKWLCTCDIVLLPYDSEAYKERTSGIFVECIIAGKIPLVTSQTWMAKELSKCGLDELSINWNNSEEIIEKILTISDDLIIKNKIIKMQEHYKKFHDIDSYAHSMKILFYD
ncbi:MAG: glycosyltransferase family 1 protein [Moorea sp. SIO2B7]|nr:glycosyltransferase family 1 protein [Moorena sp. SIO2B7]